uniref:4-hydroxybenzoate polyprenyltransferase, mitochondrial n=1 Tax=Chromera velia CCMP2878 TaxID=1169474 RepID=A0A0G4HYM9_9ALVE|mmetsp:Transcript_46540/g.91895  ORF Transcript_46540/g.91895 Transcript_46540/m.91895 type:complete len:460 (+) Transcript_46540:161-1540(+)|eukprot:Cvel_9515.t1-p1 / transcript=Cvel_9515.t1 / gene=Cvel_9515 / organism=Chromera_velia_CCMP2878 / gene_product=4-hydroxybenzoate polyprenyltransferase,, putative / transcript_product=4-hydroxybenzoate polyprenyltransferase,, putative / location=Cvel_scaffold550:53748-59870(+) / protein_length=459 / sequence_SO=supercontig / SO=protein_coding / is_pseudo=false
MLRCRLGALTASVRVARCPGGAHSASWQPGGTSVRKRLFLFPDSFVVPPETSGAVSTIRLHPHLQQQSFSTRRRLPPKIYSMEEYEDEPAPPMFTAEWFFEKIPERFHPYIRLARLHQPTGTLLLFWPSFWGLTVPCPPGALPDPLLVGTFAAGALVMRSAGCIINDLWDKDLDAKVERTKTRPLASGEITSQQAQYYLAGHLALGLGCLLQLNWFSVALGTSSLLLVVAYPYMKRITHMPQLFLGFTFNFGVPLGFAAATGGLTPVSLWLPLYLTGVCWTLVYDTIYAMQDRKDDVAAGIKSTALLWGDQTREVMSLFALSTVPLLWMTGFAMDTFARGFFPLACFPALFMLSQIWFSKLHIPSEAGRTFRSSWVVGLMISSILTVGTSMKLSDENERGALQFPRKGDERTPEQLSQAVVLSQEEWENREKNRDEGAVAATVIETGDRLSGVSSAKAQ